MNSALIEQRWRALHQRLRPEMPPLDMNLYVKPGRSCADAVARDFLVDPSACSKFLLVGAKGGGKSTELRALSAKLRDNATVIEIDLDQSGVTAASVSAYDLLYISALALLQLLPSQDAAPLFDELSSRYSGGNANKKEGLGDFKTALEGIANFAGAASLVASTAGLATGVAPIIGLAASAGSHGIRLLESSGVVPESSPQGRGLQEIADKIVRAVRKRDELPICVLIDGLEKMNGEAGERFRQVFEQTRLLADTGWSAVIAAPPSTLTETSSVDGRGFYTKPVWGFGPDDLEALHRLLEFRFKDAQLDPVRDVVAGGLELIAEKSGGLPRHAIMMVREAVIRAAVDKSQVLTKAHIDEGIDAVAQSLGRGLTAEHIQVLEFVAKTKKLPKAEKAGTLFADGRILAYPPAPGSALTRFSVHPLLVADIATALETERDGT
ncbi:hypothetical protein F0U62_02845 [Cystobacter fuscus]|uniref:hypothetical protein n=1 Tax=Cystobacter fuscus TaxID=43 RepID=UPI002B2C1963|nr:hypothetical protein F0U62_02845 [Cystobacter fuscus]